MAQVCLGFSVITLVYLAPRAEVVTLLGQLLFGIDGTSATSATAASAASAASSSASSATAAATAAAAMSGSLFPPTIGNSFVNSSVNASVNASALEIFELDAARWLGALPLPHALITALADLERLPKLLAFALSLVACVLAYGLIDLQVSSTSADGL
jgi:hypothetical protein